MTFSLMILLGLFLLFILWGVGAYNGLVRARNGWRNAFAQIDVQLQRRFELIPNLVETAKTYLAHERETLEAVIAARASAVSGLKAAKAAPGDAGAMAELDAGSRQLEGALGRLMMVSESYPELKGDAAMARLTEELASTENRVAFARQAYNDAVMSYNNRREEFPSSLVAGNFGFRPAAPLSLPSDQPEMRLAPQVRF